MGPHGMTHGQCLFIPSDPSSQEVQKLSGGIASSGLKTNLASAHQHSGSPLNREASHGPWELSQPTMKTVRAPDLDGPSRSDL